MVKISSELIDPSKVYDLIAKCGAGSIVFHYAVVKPMAGVGGTTIYIDYASSDDTEAELDGIADALKAEYIVEDILLIRRTGRLVLGDIISLVAASSTNSQDALEACRQGINLLKKMKSIVKNESRN
ncbi:MAG: molybdenum cofactor biosynthesis protein MoaE [Desulfuromonadaceae bacterium]